MSSSEFLIISAPVYQRTWILPHWFEAIEKQGWPLDQLGFTFLVAKSDTETKEMLVDYSAAHPEFRCFDLIEDDSPDHREHNGRRQWNLHRYSRMAQFRNRLLSVARCYDPDRYLSLDTDILLETPQLLEDLVEITEERTDAASPLCYMVPFAAKEYERFPNTMTWARGNPDGLAFRDNYPIGHEFETDVIMAAVMMNRKAYNKSWYEVHKQGEDLGWSRVCAKNGIRLSCVSQHYAAHIMLKEDLETYLRMGDNRSTQKCATPA